MLENPKSRLSQVEMFPLAFFLSWATKMMLYGLIVVFSLPKVFQ
jgi:hypothetical protein